jgi:thioredoxin-like negative regulator of GroEL
MNNESAGPTESNQVSAETRPTDRPSLDPGTRVESFFRKTDWFAFLITLCCVWTGYYLTLAPELTLEDSGELATASFYAGIPHPPGYPVWTLYTWLWTVLLPIKNVAWRVALGEATSGALAAGLLALLVSRGSSLLIEGIEELKTLARPTEKAICLVAGLVAGMLLGFNGFMWSQSVIVEVYSFSVASLMVVLLCLLRWIYAPQQRRFLYLALFFHGICFTNHQTLIVAAMGIEVAIAATSFRMGRYLFLGNAIIYIAGLILKQQHILTALDQNSAVFVIFNIVGIVSIACYCWFTLLSKESAPEFCLDASLAAFFLLLILVPGLGWVPCFFALAALCILVWVTIKTRKLGLEWLVVIGCGCCWILGAAFYFYMPLAGMTNPPMQWGYPRTVDGFIHAFTRGQYEKTHPTDILHDPFRFITQLAMLGDGIIEEFNWVYALVALVPFAFFFKLHKRERAWLVGITAIYLCLGVLLLILLNPPPDRAAQQLVRVFFTASHTIIALLVGYAIALGTAYMAAHYHDFRKWGLTAGAVAIALAVFSFAELTSRTFFGESAKVTPGILLSFAVQAFANSDQFGLPVYAGLILIGLSASFVAAVWFHRERAPTTIVLAICALIPLYSILTHWADNEQRNHWFGYYFGHDMFRPPFEGADHQPLYPEMAKDAILFGGTDPGRFCPTYMIFCDSFVPRRCQPSADQEFDRRDVYIITQNALADGTYLEYIRAHYNRSTQIDPPFFQELFRSDRERAANTKTNFLAHLVVPLDRYFEALGGSVEKQRRTFTSWFKPSDFLDLPGLAAKLQPGPNRDGLSQFLYDNLKSDTRKLLASPEAQQPILRHNLSRDLNELLERELAGKPGYLTGSASQKIRPEPLYNDSRFQSIHLSDYLQDFIKQNPQSHNRIRLNRLLLEEAYPRGLAKSPGGVYPDREIYTPTQEDSGRCFSEYAIEAQRRLRQNQLRPGEEVRREGDRVQISGPSAVMGINGLLTKVIFDHNPKSEFYVEESFPLEWMYPHLSPYGIIMKINRQPLPELTEDTLNTDHQFWSKYSERLIGNWITYETPVREIANWAEQVYLRRNFRGFTGDRRFIRDDQAQKSFSKLRSSIAGVYNWRIAACKPGSSERQRMLKEADFAFRQAFALCPYSPEALFRYVSLLLGPEMQRYDDALLLAKTSQKLDPFNNSIQDLVNRIQDWKAQRVSLNPARLERELRQNPSDFESALNLANEYFQLGQTGQALQALDQVLNGSNVPSPLLRSLIPVYTTLSNDTKLHKTLDLLASEFTNNPADLEAGIALAEGYRALGQTQSAIQVLQQVLTNPTADTGIIVQVAQQLASLGNYPMLETTLDKLTKLVPDSPEAWFDLAALRSLVGKSSEALQALRQALKLSAERRLRDPKAPDLLAELRQDPRFNAIRSLPEFRSLTGVK